MTFYGLFENNPTQEELYKISEQQAHNRACKELAAACDAYVNKAYTLLCDYLHLLEDWKVMYAPQSLGEMEESEKHMNPCFITACQQLDYIGYLVDSLIWADFEGQAQFYKTHRKEMVTIADKIEQYSKSRDAYGSALQ